MSLYCCLVSDCVLLRGQFEFETILLTLYVTHFTVFLCFVFCFKIALVFVFIAWFTIVVRIGADLILVADAIK